MTSQLYPSFKELLLGGDIDLANDDIRAVLVDTADYTFSTAHDFLDDVAAGGRVATLGAGMSGKSITAGVFDATDITFTSVTGDQSEALIIYKHTGSDATAPLIAYIDSATGLPVTPNGGDIDIQWDSGGNKIFAL